MSSAARLAGVLIVALTLAACGANGAAPGFGAEDVSTIRAKTAEFEEAFNAKNFDQLANFYLGAAVFMPPNSSTVRGQEAIKGFLQEMIAEGAGDLEMEIADVGGAGDIAFQSGSYVMMLRPANGGELRDRGKFLIVLRKAGGQWLWEQVMWSSDLPEPTVVTPPPPPAEDAEEK